MKVRKEQAARLSAKTTGRPTRCGQVLDRKGRAEVVEPMAPEARQLFKFFILSYLLKKEEFPLPLITKVY